MPEPDQQRLVYGPYHRLLSDTQAPDTMVKQLLSGEAWGKPARFGADPAAKAYRGPLRPGDEGFEFWAFGPPDSGRPRRILARSLGVSRHRQ